jgi:hypothetical protein
MKSNNIIKLFTVKKSYTHILILGIIIFLNSSCVHYYYAPSSNNVPLFKEKGEARIQAQYTSTAVQVDDAANGFEIQTAYAAGNHTALQLNFFHASENDEGYGSGSGNYIEAAYGYFKPFGKNRWVFETYAGLGFGGVTNVFENDYYSTEQAKTSITKFFVQPSIGFTTKYFDVAFSSKFSLVNLGLNNSTLSKENNEYDYEYVESLRNGKSYFFWERGLMIRGGFEHVKAVIQLTETIMSDDTQPISNGSISLGLAISLNAKHK